MRILATADLHYDIWRSRQPAERLASQIIAAGGDVLILAGDTAGIDSEKLAQCLQLFDRFSGLFTLNFTRPASLSRYVPVKKPTATFHLDRQRLSRVRDSQPVQKKCQVALVGVTA